MLIGILIAVLAIIVIFVGTDEDLAVKLCFDNDEEEQKAKDAQSSQSSGESPRARERQRSLATDESELVAQILSEEPELASDDAPPPRRREPTPPRRQPRGATPTTTGITVGGAPVRPAQSDMDSLRRAAEERDPNKKNRSLNGYRPEDIF